MLQISTCTHPYIIHYLEQREWNSPARKCRLASAGWVGAGVFNGCYMCVMHKHIAEFLRHSQINRFSCWSKIGAYCPSSTLGTYRRPPPAVPFTELEVVTCDTKPSVQGTEPLIFICKAVSKLWRKVERGLLMGRSQLQIPIWEEEGTTSCLLLCLWDAQEEMPINSFVLSRVWIFFFKVLITSYSAHFSIIHYFV